MTASEWLASTDPQQMLAALPNSKRSQRKFRHFAVACDRRTSLEDPTEADENTHAAAVAERFADGLASAEELAEVHVCQRTSGATWIMAKPDAATAALQFSQSDDSDCGQEEKADLLRDIFGNPFRRRKFIKRELLTTTIVSLAQAAYEERLANFDLDSLRLSILADALEESGCADEAAVAHLRTPGPHIRGCWVVDLCLGKE